MDSMNSMDPLDPSTFNHRTEKLSTGRTYHFVDQIPVDYDPRRSKALLCVHGFPDCWYGWRHQIKPWVLAGYRVIVPDKLGYGGTDKPADPSEYSTKKVCADLAALLDLLHIRQAVVVGHDWGAVTAGRFALWHPERLSKPRCAGNRMNVPYTPPSKRYFSIEDVAKFAPNLGYQADFAEQATTSKVESQLPKFLSSLYAVPVIGVDRYSGRGALHNRMLAKDSKTPQIVHTEKEFEFYKQLFKDGGMNGPLNWYRTSKYRFEEEKAANLPANLPSDLPVLFLWGTADVTCAPSTVVKARKFITRYQEVALEGKGHWILVEAKEEVTKKVVDWLQSLYSSKPGTKGLHQSKL